MTSKTATVGQSETCEQCCTEENSGVVEQNPSRTGACDTQDTGVCDGNESTTVLCKSEASVEEVNSEIYSEVVLDAMDGKDEGTIASVFTTSSAGEQNENVVG
ncbi:hypothetical protein GN244_ATG15684 [Phytophthora infestans]|uniref:Uncharacterized protein n=1 Tax=Phytophthora infestans TaxID=4787 RepID=A0A833VX30_PHYIN|nr:hypothetical protein GN244_ATG15684 [Phytophthora infestans]